MNSAKAVLAKKLEDLKGRITSTESNLKGAESTVASYKHQLVNLTVEAREIEEAIKLLNKGKKNENRKNS